ncbi:MAG: hypothetical protein RLZZ28_673 [Bacteroidota bacterium]
MKWLLLIIAANFFCTSCETGTGGGIHGLPAEFAGAQPLIGSRVWLATDTSLHLVNGIRYAGSDLLNGTIETYYASGGLKSRQSFAAGREEGEAVTYYEDGRPDAKRYFHLGEKDSVHTGWWPNGKRRFEYHFKEGMYEGSFKEWYASGKPLKEIHYGNGKEISGKGWRENGKPYMSFVVRGGRLYGLINPNLCYSLKNEKGEFIASVPTKKSPL